MQPEYILTDVTDELAAIAAKIDANVRASDELLIEAARLLAGAKARFDSGEIIETTWREWSSETLSLGQRRIYDLLRIGEAEDPLFELRLQRELNAKRQADFRARRAAALGYSLYAQRLIDWAKAAPEDDVERAVHFVSTLPSARAGQRQSAPTMPPRRIDYDLPRPPPPGAPALRNANRARPLTSEQKRAPKQLTGPQRRLNALLAGIATSPPHRNTK